VAKSKGNINKGVKLYGKILKEFTRVNNQLPEDRKVSLADRRKYIKEKIYPQFKGTHPSKVGIKAIRTQIDGVLETIIPQEGCDPNVISPSVYADVMWFDLDEFIRDVLPKCIYIRVDFDSIGKTRIFNTLNYDYNKSGVRIKIDKLRDEIGNSSNASFVGVKKLKPNKANDGTPENYFIDFILTINNRPTKSIEPIPYTLSKEQKKSVTSVRNAIISRVKDLNNKKKRRVNARKKAKEKISDIKRKNKRIKRAKSKDFKNKLLKERLREYIRLKNQLKNSFNKGNLTKEQFDRFNDDIDKLIDDVKKQGGIL
jgi:hypothetical protein